MLFECFAAIQIGKIIGQLLGTDSTTQLLRNLGQHLWAQFTSDKLQLYLYYWEFNDTALQKRPEDKLQVYYERTHSNVLLGTCFCVSSTLSILFLDYHVLLFTTFQIEIPCCFHRHFLALQSQGTPVICYFLCGALKSKTKTKPQYFRTSTSVQEFSQGFTHSL